MVQDLIEAPILKHYPTVQAVYLFGSYGKNEAWPDSDVDLPRRGGNRGR